MGYKALCLDFYGTLAEEDDRVIAEILKALAAQSPVSSDTEQIRRVWYDYFLTRCTTAWGENFKRQCDIEIESLEHVFSRFETRLAPADCYEKLFHNWKTPRKFEDADWFLRHNSLPVCIVSNIDTDDVLQAIANNGWYFEHIVTSEMCQSYKPRPEMFERALDLLQCRPEEVLHIGDSLNSDVAGAQALGITAAWINRKNRPLPDNTPVPTFIINDFYQLPNLL